MLFLKMRQPGRLIVKEGWQGQGLQRNIGKGGREEEDKIFMRV